MGTYDRQNVNPVARSVGAHPPSTWGSIPATWPWKPWPIEIDDFPS